MQTTEHTMQMTTGARPGVKTFFNRQWWWTTLLVLVGVAVLVRLGFWQLDRLAQRRAYNAEVIAKLALPPISLNDERLPEDLPSLRFRQAEVQGEYDFSRQVALTQQSWINTPGFDLVTPLVFESAVQSEGKRPLAVLVDRGWLPAAELDQRNWSKYDVSGQVSVTGYIRLSQILPDAAGDAESIAGIPQTEWYRVDVAAIEAQLPYELLPVYLQQVPPADRNDRLPFRGELEPDLSDGPHLSYAIQWFIFATILVVGYVFFVRKRTIEPVDDGE